MTSTGGAERSTISDDGLQLFTDTSLLVDIGPAFALRNRAPRPTPRHDAVGANCPAIVWTTETTEAAPSMV